MSLLGDGLSICVNHADAGVMRAVCAGTSIRALCYPAGVVGLGREARKGTLDRQRGVFLADATLLQVQAQCCLHEIFGISAGIGGAF